MARGLHVRISDDAHRGWMRMSLEHGVTLTALLEVLGRRGPTTAFDSEALREVVVEARQLAHERRAAGGPRPAANRTTKRTTKRTTDRRRQS